tara:strand:- start:4091 stop:4288 length:198 start_codon:yes stop_codon:yes gene_type:complete
MSSQLAAQVDAFNLKRIQRENVAEVDSLQAQVAQHSSTIAELLTTVKDLKRRLDHAEGRLAHLKN